MVCLNALMVCSNVPTVCVIKRSDGLSWSSNDWSPLLMDRKLWMMWMKSYIMNGGNWIRMNWIGSFLDFFAVTYYLSPFNVYIFWPSTFHFCLCSVMKQARDRVVNEQTSNTRPPSINNSLCSRQSRRLLLLLCRDWRTNAYGYTHHNQSSL